MIDQWWKRRSTDEQWLSQLTSEVRKSMRNFCAMMPRAFSSRATKFTRKKRSSFRWTSVYLRHFLMRKRSCQWRRFVYISALRSVSLGRCWVDRREPFDLFALGWNERIRRNRICTPASKRDRTSDYFVHRDSHALRLAISRYSFFSFCWRHVWMLLLRSVDQAN